MDANKDNQRAAGRKDRQVAVGKQGVRKAGNCEESHVLQHCKLQERTANASPYHKTNENAAGIGWQSWHERQCIERNEQRSGNAMRKQVDSDLIGSRKCAKRVSRSLSAISGPAMCVALEDV